MLELQVKQLFKYHIVLISVIIAIIALSRVVGITLMKNDRFSQYMSPNTAVEFDKLLDSTSDMTLEECAEYIERKQTEAIINGEDKAVTEAITRYNTELQRCFAVRGYRNYSRYGKGIVSLNIPSDLKAAPEKYRGYAVPRVVNSDAFSRYIFLSSFSIMPIIVMLITAVLSADGLEKGVFKQTNISAEAKAFYRAKEIMTVVFICIIYIADQLSVMLLSGVFERPEYRTSSVQGIVGFGTSAFRGTISQVIMWVFIRGLLSMLLCYNIFELIAKALSSLKKYIIVCTSLTALLSVSAAYMPALSPYMFCGITKISDVLYDLDYVKSLDASEGLIVIISMCSLLGGLFVWRRENNIT